MIYRLENPKSVTITEKEICRINYQLHLTAQFILKRRSKSKKWISLIFSTFLRLMLFSCNSQKFTNLIPLKEKKHSKYFIPLHLSRMDSSDWSKKCIFQTFFRGFEINIIVKKSFYFPGASSTPKKSPYHRHLPSQATRVWNAYSFNTGISGFKELCKLQNWFYIKIWLVIRKNWLKQLFDDFEDCFWIP